MYQTLKTVFDHISKHLEVRQKHSTECRIFDSLVSVWKCGENRSFVFDMYGLLTKCEVKMAGYWPGSFFACLWTETESRSINTQKKNEANIKPS